MFLALAYSLDQSWRWKPKDVSVQLFGWMLLVAAAAALGGLLAASATGTAGLWFGVGAFVGALPIIGFAVLHIGKLTWGQKQVISFVAVAALAFIYFYPIWTGIGLSSADYYRHMWLKSWL